jgi:hypothetical protein
MANVAFPAVLCLVSLCSVAPAQSTTTAPPSPQAPATSVLAQVPAARAAAAAAKVDTLLAAGLKQRGKQPTPVVDDSTFVRRAYLQVIGRIPSLSEAEAFLQDQAADKRPALIDRLLDSPGYTSHESNFWFDLLRVRSRQRQTSGEPFAHWIREAVRQGMPYDEFVRAMLTATGAAHKEGNGATGYLLRDANMPHDAMANTLRLFAGTRLECAQCHNHPTDKWTQRDFYSMAAFFGGLRYRLDVDRELQGQLRQAMASADERSRQAARRALQQFATGLQGSGTGSERLPPDYKYDDARPREAVVAATVFGPETNVRRPAPAPARNRRPAPAPEVDSRAVFADWLTSPKNQRFVTVITNRVWLRLFGAGLVEPVDDLKDDTVAVHPALQRHLEKLLVELDFDLRQFERVLLRTQLFQQEALAADPPPGEPYAFEAPLLRRLDAAQLWDSLLTLVFADVDERLRPTDARARDVYARHRELDQGTPEAMIAALQQPDRLQERRQALIAERRAMEQERQPQIRALQRELAAARRRGDAAAQEKVLADLQALGVPRPGERAVRGREGELLRASDLVQPAPGNHLLRQFGQSDRETIDGSSRAATVPQALTLLNGAAAGPLTSLQHALAQAKDPAAKVRTAYLAMLTRGPRPYEEAFWCHELARDAAQGTQDLAWVLLNSNEFRFLP